MNWLRTRLLGPYFSLFSINSYGYYTLLESKAVLKEREQDDV